MDHSSLQRFEWSRKLEGVVFKRHLIRACSPQDAEEESMQLQGIGKRGKRIKK